MDVRLRQERKRRIRPIGKRHLTTVWSTSVVCGAEFRGEGRRPGADRRARPRSVRGGGQDEARAQRPDHGGEGEPAVRSGSL